LGRIAHGDPELKELMAEYIKLELESLVLANEIRDEKNQDEKEELSDELNEVLEKAFDKKVTLKTKGLEHLEQKLKETREELQSRKDNKEAIIKNRYDVLTGSETSLEW
jgi:flagellar capping protein FliD